MRRGFFGEDVNKSMKCFNGPPHSPPTHHAKNHLFSMLSVIRELNVVPNTEQLHSKIGCKTFPFLDQTETQGSYNRSSPERVNKPFATCNSSWEAARRSAANNVLLRRLSFLFFFLPLWRCRPFWSLLYWKFIAILGWRRALKKTRKRREHAWKRNLGGLDFREAFGSAFQHVSWMVHCTSRSAYFGRFVDQLLSQHFPGLFIWLR